MTRSHYADGVSMLPLGSNPWAAFAAGLIGLAGCQNEGSRTVSRAGPSTVRSFPRPLGSGAGFDVDLDGRAMERELGCAAVRAGSPRGEACRVLAEFAHAGEVESLPDTGQTTWYGEAFVLLLGHAEWREFYFLQCRPGRGMSAAPIKTAMEFSVAARALIPRDDQQTADAEALLAALRAGSAVPTDNPALRFVKTAEPEDGFQGLYRAGGPSLHFDEFARNHWLRQAGSRWLMLEQQPGEICAVELWPVP